MTNVPQLPVFNGPIQTIKKDISFLAHHLILTAVIVLVLFGGVWGVQNIIEKHDAAKAVQSQQALAAVVDQVKRLEQTQAQHDAEVAQRDAARDAREAQLIAAISSRDKALDDLIKKNATLTAQQAAARLTEQYKAAPGEVTANGDTVIADLPIARQFVDSFDSLQTCKANLTDANTQVAVEQSRVADLRTQVSDRDKTIDSKNDELKKQIKADADDKKLAVDKEKKKHKWYAMGGILLIEGIRIYFTGKP
jgi:hypothetical protein